MKQGKGKQSCQENVLGFNKEINNVSFASIPFPWSC